MFGDVRLHVNRVYAFNHEIVPLYENPECREDGCTVLWDCSGSMLDHETSGLIKLVLSMFKCIGRLQGCVNLPAASGRTALLDCIDRVLLEHPETRRLFVLTDGNDTCSTTQSVIGGVDSDSGRPLFVDMPALPASRKEWKGTSEEYRAYRRERHARRSDMIAQHCKFLNISMAVVGIGTGVADTLPAFLRTGTIPVGFVPKGASPGDVTAVMATTVRRTRERVASEPTLITPANAGAASAEEVAAVVREAARTTTHAERRARPEKYVRDGPPFDPEKQRAYVEWVVRRTVAEPVRGEIAPRFGDMTPRVEELALVALSFFAHKIVIRGTVDAPVSGDILAGRQYFRDGGVVCSGLVAPFVDLPVSRHRLAGVFKKLLQRLSVDPEYLATQLRGLGDAFGDQIATNTVGALFKDCGEDCTTFALTAESGLPQLEDETRYYKFRSTSTYPCVHYVLNHRAEACTLGREESYPSLPIVHAGNVSRHAFLQAEAETTRKRTAEDANIAGENS